MADLRMNYKSVEQLASKIQTLYEQYSKMQTDLDSVVKSFNTSWTGPGRKQFDERYNATKRRISLVGSEFKRYPEEILAVRKNTEYTDKNNKFENLVVGGVCWRPTDGNNSSDRTSMTDNPYRSYRQKVDKINDANPYARPQAYSNGKTNDGICNISSVETLLNRRLVLDGKKNQEFSDYDIYTYTYPSKITIKGYDIYGDPNSGTWWDKTYKNSNGTVYKTNNLRTRAVEKKVSEIIKNNNELSKKVAYKQYLCDLLDEHPEGICIRATYGKYGHVIVITDYEMIDGEIQLYAIDPVNERYSLDVTHKKHEQYMNNAGRIKIEDTWLFKETSVSFENLLSRTDAIVWLTDN